MMGKRHAKHHLTISEGGPSEVAEMSEHMRSDIYAAR